MIFRSVVDKQMVNTGTKSKPFISVKVELREYFLGPLRYCSVRTEKSMENIGDENRPFYVKAQETIKVKVLGIPLRDKEQFFNHEKL